MFLALVLSAPAAACGGFFCSPAVQPIDQAAEEIVFALDEENEEIEMHIAIAYEGQSDDFAWVLPVPEEPELFLSSSQMFAELQGFTAPVFTYTPTSEGRCRERLQLGCSATKGLVDTDAGYEGVTVVDGERVGPYETVTLRAQTADDLLDWLIANDYDLPPDLEPLLAPYVAQESYFVAMRLAADADTGDIEPIGLRYPGTEMAIPIQLTAVAATEDMPLRVYVFGGSRAVPGSYLHVEINEAAIDWLGFGSNYAEVVAAAADEAGGQAFVTEYAGTTKILSDATDPTLVALTRHHGTLTRLLSAMSPDEMTVDPTFVLNPNLFDVDNVHTAELVVDCRGNKKTNNAPRRLELADGQVVYLPAISETPRRTSDTIADQQVIPALRVERMKAASPSEVLADYREDAFEAVEAHNSGYESGGCGCATGALPASTLMVFGTLGLALRRRRINAAGLGALGKNRD